MVTTKVIQCIILSQRITESRRVRQDQREWFAEYFGALVLQTNLRRISLKAPWTRVNWGELYGNLCWSCSEYIVTCGLSINSLQFYNVQIILCVTSLKVWKAVFFHSFHPFEFQGKWQPWPLNSIIMLRHSSVCSLLKHRRWFSSL